MAEVEKRADSRLALICRHDGRFQGDISPDDVGGDWFLEPEESRRVTGQDLGEIASFPARRRALDHGVLHHLCPAGATFTAGIVRNSAVSAMTSGG